MWILVSAILTASLLGSMHCVGMCGPIAVLASHSGSRASHGQAQSRSRTTLNASFYHFGRLLTYMLAGAIAGTLGSLVDVTGEVIGFQVAAARLVGGIMIVVGLHKLYRLAIPQRFVQPHSPTKIGELLIKVRPWLQRLPGPSRALGMGLLTTLLPCGWLYLFALIAAGTGSYQMGTMVMAAFWLGTVPALVGVIASASVLSKRFKALVPAAAAILLMLTGSYTAVGRGFADLSRFNHLAQQIGLERDLSTSHPMQIAESIESLAEEPLPCCVEE